MKLIQKRIIKWIRPVAKIGKTFFVLTGIFPNILWAGNVCKPPKSPNIEVTIKTVPPVYSNDFSMYEFDDFQKRNHLSKASETHKGASGITFSERISICNIETDIVRQGKGWCVYPKKIHFTIGYKTMMVLIDKKYRPNTCEYNEIIKHENTHVLVHYLTLQEQLPYLKEELEKNLQYGIYTSSRLFIERNRGRIAEQINDITQKHLRRINTIIYNKNAMIDTEASYQEATSHCSNW